MIETAGTILNRIKAELENGPEENCGYDATIETDNGEMYVWIRHNESCNPEHVEKLVKALHEDMNLTGITVVSWSDSCSKPRVDEFGGGAFAVKTGMPTIWVNAASEARRQMLQAVK